MKVFRNKVFDAGIIVLGVILLLIAFGQNSKKHVINREIAITEMSTPYIIASDRSNHVAVRYHLDKNTKENQYGSLAGFEAVSAHYDAMKKDNTLVLLYPGIEKLDKKYEEEFYPIKESVITPRGNEIARAFFKMDQGKYRGIIATYESEGFEKAITYLLNNPIMTNTVITIN